MGIIWFEKEIVSTQPWAVQLTGTLSFLHELKVKMLKAKTL
jgi:hypothetical protein